MRAMLILTVLLSTTSVASAANVQEETATDILALQGITVSTEKRREMMARLLRIGMNNSRSDRLEDADNVVCLLRKRTGSHLKDLTCATNSTHAYLRELNFIRNSGMIAQLSTSPRFSSNARQMVRGGTPSGFAHAFGNSASARNVGAIFTLRGATRSKVNALINDYAAGVSDEENREFLVRDMIWSNFTGVDSRYGWSADQYTAFVLAYKEIKALEKSSHGSKSSLETAMANAILVRGLSIDSYNAMLDQVMADEDLRIRTLRALNIKL